MSNPSFQYCLYYNTPMVCHSGLEVAKGKSTRSAAVIVQVSHQPSTTAGLNARQLRRCFDQVHQFRPRAILSVRLSSRDASGSGDAVLSEIQARGYFSSQAEWPAALRRLADSRAASGAALGALGLMQVRLWGHLGVAIGRSD